MIDLLSPTSIIGGDRPPAEWPLRWTAVESNDSAIIVLWWRYRVRTDSYLAQIATLGWDGEAFSVVEGQCPDAPTLLELTYDLLGRHRYEVDDTEFLSLCRRVL